MAGKTCALSRAYHWNNHSVCSIVYDAAGIRFWHCIIKTSGAKHQETKKFVDARGLWNRIVSNCITHSSGLELVLRGTLRPNGLFFLLLVHKNMADRSPSPPFKKV